MALPATPIRLYSGEWGARVAGAPSIGDIVTITTRGGKSWDARVTAVHHATPDGAVCSAESLEPRPAKPARGRGRGRGGSSSARFSSGAEVYTNRAGRCEDAPCCGCCT
jgi:hypothetical protein